MHIERKRIPAIILCFLMSFFMIFVTACGGTSSGPGFGGSNTSAGGETTYGRYIESDVTPPGTDDSFQCFSLADGTIVCFDMGYKTRFESKDGGATWSSSLGLGAGSDRYADKLNGAIAPDGSLIIFIEEEGLFHVSPDGVEQKIPVAEIDEAIASGNGVMMSSLKALSADRLFLSYMLMSGGGGNFSVQRNIGSARIAGGTGVTRSAPVDGAATEAQTDIEVAGDPDAEAGGGFFIGAPLPEDFDPDVDTPFTGRPFPDSDEAGDSDNSEPDSGGQTYRSVPIGASSSFKSGLFALDGSSLADFSNLNVVSATAEGETVYVLDNDSNQILAYSLSDGKRSDKPSRNIPSEGGGSGGAIRIGGGPGAPMSSIRGGLFGGGSIAADSAGAVYMLTGRDLMRIGGDGTAETLLYGTSYSIGAPSAMIGSILPLSDGSFLVQANFMEEGSKLYKYIWDENAVNDPSQTLNVWSLEDSTFIRSVIAAFRSANPDTVVNYEVALSGDSGLSSADAVKNLNTRMLSGAAPDVIILDGCPAESYASQGLLLNLTGQVDTSAMFANVLAPFDTSSGLWYLPGQFSFPVLIGSGAELGALSSLEALANAVVSGNNLPQVNMEPGGRGSFGGLDESERSTLYFAELYDLFDLVWTSSASEIVKGGALDVAALEKMLTLLKNMSDKYELGTPADMMSGMVAMFSVAGGGSAMRVPDSAIWYSQQRTNYGAFTVSSLPLLALQSERPGSALAPFPGLSGDSFIPSSLAAVSADTNVEALAIDFVRTMLSIGVQSITYTAGLPVTEQGLQTQIDDFNERANESDRDPLNLNLFAIAGSLSVPVLTDEVLTDAVWTEVERLCAGELDVARAVGNIEQSIKTYLAERA